MQHYTRIGVRVALGIVAAGVFLACGSEPEVDNSALRERLAYVENLSEVAWLEFDGGDVYIGFSRRPPDLANIVNTAAVAGHQAHGARVTVWAVDGGAPGWRPGDGEPFCKVTIRLGSIEEPCT